MKWLASRVGLRSVAVGAAVLTVGGCDVSDGQGEPGGLPIISFERLFALEREMRLEESQDAPLADATDVVWWGERVAVVDRMQANVKIYDRDGRLVRVIGRAGRGPGEFVAPIGIAALAGGRLGIYDAGRNVFTVFSDLGEYQSDWMVPLSRVDAVIALPSGRALAFGSPGLGVDESAGGEPSGVVHLVDADGNRSGTVGYADAPRHLMEDAFNGAVLGAYESVILWGVKTSNVVHMYDRATGRATARPIAGALYRPPEWPRHRPGDPGTGLSAITEWANRQMWLNGLLALDRDTYVVRFTAPGPDGERRSSYVLATAREDVVATHPTAVALRHAGSRGLLGITRDPTGAVLVGIYSLDPAYRSTLKRRSTEP